MADILGMYEFDRRKAKDFLKYLTAASIRDHMQKQRHAAEDSKVTVLDQKIGQLEERNKELTGHIMELSRRLQQMQELNERSKKIIVDQEKEEELLTERLEEVATEIDDKNNRLEELEKKIEDKLGKQEEASPQMPVVKNRERIRELEEKIKRKLEGQKLDPIRQKIKELEDLHATLSKSRKIPKKKLDLLRARIDKLQKRISRI